MRLALLLLALASAGCAAPPEPPSWTIVLETDEPLQADGEADPMASVAWRWGNVTVHANSVSWTSATHDITIRGHTMGPDVYVLGQSSDCLFVQDGRNSSSFGQRLRVGDSYEVGLGGPCGGHIGFRA